MLFTILGFLIGCGSGRLINRLFLGPDESYMRDTRIFIGFFCIGAGTATGFIYGANLLQNRLHPYNYLLNKCY